MMPVKNIPQEILIVSTNAYTPNVASAPRRSIRTNRLPRIEKVNIEGLQSQINIFLDQMNIAISKAPEKVGGFRLSELEVSAGIVVEAKGGVKLALLASGEVSGCINGGVKFVFKRD
jgi:hypothetical protein